MPAADDEPVMLKAVLIVIDEKDKQRLLDSLGATAAISHPRDRLRNDAANAHKWGPRGSSIEFDAHMLVTIDDFGDDGAPAGALRKLLVTKDERGREKPCTKGKLRMAIERCTKSGLVRSEGRTRTTRYHLTNAGRLRVQELSNATEEDIL